MDAAGRRDPSNRSLEWEGQASYATLAAMLQRVVDWLKRAFELPEVRGLDHDSPELIRIHDELIRRKPFLRALYREHYRELARRLKDLPEGPVVEIGSGGGFVKEVLPSVLTTDLHPAPHVDRVMSAQKLEFPDGSVSAIVMLNVFHHVPNPRQFLTEAVRVLKPGGRIVLIEPAHTWLWRRLYKLFAAEPYDAGAADWGFPPAGRFTGANVPQAWIVFERDDARFRAEFPDLRPIGRRRHTAFLYLLSGGIWFRGLVPAWSFPVFLGAERLLEPLMPLLASQTTYVFERSRPGDSARLPTPAAGR